MVEAEASAFAQSVGRNWSTLAVGARDVFGGCVAAGRVGMWAMHLVWRGEKKNPYRALAELRASTATSACGYVFKHGDIAWNCRTCQKDNTCVLCDACFQRSAHVGHEVFFHRASPGGCCDCGDLEAWLGDACCEVHQPKASEDPMEALPPDLRRAAAIVVRAAVVALCDVAARCAVAHAGRGNVVRLHNDDVHSVDQVAEALRSAGVAADLARRAVEEADRVGEAVVRWGAGSTSTTRERLAALQSRGLLASAVDADHLAREERAVAIANWLAELVRGSDGMRRLVATEFARELGSSDVEEFEDSKFGLRFTPGGELFAGETRLAATPFAFLIACDALVTKSVRLATHDVLLRLLVDSVARSAVAEALLGAYSFISRLYARGVGTSEDTIFALSVQIFTTPSLVKNALPDVLWVVASALLEALETAGCDARRERGRQRRAVQVVPPPPPPDTDDAFLDTDVVQHRRFAHAVRDLEYVLQTDDVAAVALSPPSSSNGNGRAFDAVLALLSRLQGLDPAVRRDRFHVEYESRRWIYAFNLVLNVSSTSELVAQRAFEDPPRLETAILEPRDRALAARHAHRAAIAALLEWLDAREGSYDWLPLDPPAKPLVLRFDAASEPVSLHLPLHRLIAQLALCAASAGADALPPLLDETETPPALRSRILCCVARLKGYDAAVRTTTTPTLGASSLDELVERSVPDEEATRVAGLLLDDTTVDEVVGVALAEHPLRALAWCAHVGAGLWRRNGTTAQQQALNYASPPLSHSLRDVDQQCVLLGAKLLGADRAVEAILRVFLVDRYLLAPAEATPRAAATSAARLGRSDDDDDNNNRAAEPSFVSGASDHHRRPDTTAARRPRRRQPPPAEFLGFAASEAVVLVIRLATDVPSPPGSARAKLRRELVHALAVAPRRHSEVVAVVSNAAKACGLSTVTTRGSPVAPVADQLLELISRRAAESALWDLRAEVAGEYDPAFARLGRAAHEKAIERVAKFRGPRKDGKPRPLVGPPPPAHADFEDARRDILGCDATHRACVGALLRGDAPDARELECRALHLLTLVAHQGPEFLAKWATTEDDDCVLRLLIGLRSKARAATDYFGSPIYDEGLDWLLARAGGHAKCRAFLAAATPPADATKKQQHQTAASSAAAAAAAADDDDDRVGGGGAEDDAAAKRRKRDSARKRALEAMSRSQAAFAELLEEKDEDMAADDEDDDDDVRAGAQKKSEPREPRECIVCWSRTSETPCLVALAQRSCVLARGVERSSPARRRLRRTFEVRGRACELRERRSDEEGVKLEAGQMVRALAMRDGAARVRVLAPGGGDATCGWVRESELRPVVDRAWRRWGKTRVHVATCGHAVHPGCWDKFFGSLLSKVVAGELFEGRLCVDPRLGQFLCPLCKAASNCLLPDVPPAPASSLPPPPWSLARWALAGGRDASDPDADAAAAAANALEPDDDEPAWASQQHWGRRFSASLCDVGDGHAPGIAPSPLAELFATWSAAAYCATITATTRDDAKPPPPETGSTFLDSRRHGVAAASALARALEYFPRAILADSSSGLDRLTALKGFLAALLAGERLMPRVSADLTALGAARPDDVDVGTWRADADWRVRTALAQPLLSWDLGIALAAFASVWPCSDLAKVVAVLSLARLAQILVEEEPRSEEEEEEEEEGFETLRSAVCGVDERWCGQTLARRTRDAWAPFLRTALFVSRRRASDESDEPNYDEPEDDRLLEELGVPAPRELAKSEEVRALFKAWGDRLRELEGRERVVVDDRDATDETYFYDFTANDPPLDEDDEEQRRVDLKEKVASTAVSRRRRPTDAVLDLSLMALPRTPAFGFVDLPESFTDLYTALVEHRNSPDDDPALCLLTGRVVQAGKRAAQDAPGACTLHARTNGGVGVFFLALRCSTLLVSGSSAAYSVSLYLDDYGEEDVNLRRGAPLHLSRSRLRLLERLYNDHGVPAEVARRRAESPRVIRDNFY
ncbi:hypothetical protein CTAYLR_008064 [Chrysophaeum taylorii]|uniref:E3 ubiquitin-protein ligase n=1 Tax=Chrysophaeum taylorii TaxID=2483200 RepID=A0AAD7ULX8_9STRA|nr:hypothetical protein CTAYLR_008064 [Chrysophaeum taylorii]